METMSSTGSAPPAKRRSFAQRLGTARNRRESAESSSKPIMDGDWAQILAAAECWAQTGHAYFPVTQVVDKVPSGAYRCMASNRGPYLEKMPIEIDQLIMLPDSATDKLMDEFKTFWTLKENFASRGFTFKRGLLLYGPPGSGKTSAIWQMTQELIKTHDGVVIFVEDPNLATACISMLRRIEPDRPLITIMEDLDTLVQRHGEHGYLALLDGENQISNVIHVATTNYPEYLDKRFADRPSRFDTIMEVDMPSEEARRTYFKAKEPNLPEHTLNYWVRKTEDYSVAHLREVIIATQCFKQNAEDVFKRLNEMREAQLKSDNHKDFGFYMDD